MDRSPSEPLTEQCKSYEQWTAPASRHSNLNGRLKQPPTTQNESRHVHCRAVCFSLHAPISLLSAAAQSLHPRRQRLTAVVHGARRPHHPTQPNMLGRAAAVAQRRRLGRLMTRRSVIYRARKRNQPCARIIEPSRSQRWTRPAACSGRSRAHHRTERRQWCWIAVLFLSRQALAHGSSHTRFSGGRSIIKECLHVNRLRNNLSVNRLFQPLDGQWTAQITFCFLYTCFLSPGPLL